MVVRHIKEREVTHWNLSAHMGMLHRPGCCLSASALTPRVASDACPVAVVRKAAVNDATPSSEIPVSPMINERSKVLDAKA